MYGFIYSCMIEIISPQLYGFIYSCMIEIISPQLYGFIYSCMVEIISPQLYGFIYSCIIEIVISIIQEYLKPYNCGIIIYISYHITVQRNTNWGKFPAYNAIIAIFIIKCTDESNFGIK